MEEMPKILIITQIVDKNNDVLGFFHRWIEEFSKNCERVTVICLQKGEYDLPGNVKVFSLGKEAGVSKIKYFLNFYKYIWKERKRYDSVFVHMNPEYVLWGGWVWILMGKKISLWYTHKKINCKLRIAEKIVDKIFTASKESFRLSSKKVVVTGHGIDTNKFKSQNAKPKYQMNGMFKIITVGRITQTKNIDVLIKTAAILKEDNFNFKIVFAGSPIHERDRIYFNKVKEDVLNNELNEKIEFLGSISYGKIEEFYKEGDLFINLSDTGSIDKAVLEAMSSGLKVLTSNEAFKNILPEQYLVNKDPKAIAEKILALNLKESDKDLREYVVENHNLETLIKKIV